MSSGCTQRSRSVYPRPSNDGFICSSQGIFLTWSRPMQSLMIDLVKWVSSLDRMDHYKSCLLSNVSDRKSASSSQWTLDSGVECGIANNLLKNAFAESCCPPCPRSLHHVTSEIVLALQRVNSSTIGLLPNFAANLARHLLFLLSLEAQVSLWRFQFDIWISK